jgi:hypothetical protein
MTRTRRRKIARSVAIRRVKQNAKRKERKTQKRKSRNKVMRGGVHKNLKVYVIQKKLGSPECVIVRQKSVTKDTIYLFFVKGLPPDEIKKFVCAAMGLDVGVVITPEFKNNSGKLIVKLSGNVSYSLSGGFFTTDSDGEPLPISNTRFGNYIISESIETKNGEEIIKSLEEKTKTMVGDYTFTDITKNGEFFKGVYNVFDDEDFNLNDVLELFKSVETNTMSELNKFCLVPEKPIFEKIEKLKKLVQDSQLVDDICRKNAGNLLRGKSDSRSTELKTQIEESKRKTLEEIKDAKLYYSETDATTLIDDITKDPSYGTCIPAIQRIGYGQWSEYINGERKIDYVEKNIADAYAGSYHSVY